MRAAFLGALASLLIALPAHAKVMSITGTAPTWGRPGSCASPDPDADFPAEARIQLVVEVGQAGVEVWRTSIAEVAPGLPFVVTTPDLAPGEYSVWARFNNGTTHGCDTTITMHVVADPPPPRFYVNTEWTITGAIVDRITGRLVLPHEMAGLLNSADAVLRP